MGLVYPVLDGSLYHYTIDIPIYHLDFATWLFAMGGPRWRALGGPFRSSGGLLRRGGASALKRGACLDLCASAVHVEF